MFKNINIFQKHTSKKLFSTSHDTVIKMPNLFNYNHVIIFGIYVVGSISLYKYMKNNPLNIIHLFIILNKSKICVADNQISESYPDVSTLFLFFKYFCSIMLSNNIYNLYNK